MREIVGHVDERNRPLVSISIPDRDDALLAHIDTGFNGYLFIHETLAEQLGFINTGVTIKVEFADHSQHQPYVARGRISWFGEHLTIDVFISSASISRAAAPDEPVALLGTALLSPHKLNVDFAARRVAIAQAE